MRRAMTSLLIASALASCTSAGPEVRVSRPGPAARAPATNFFEPSTDLAPEQLIEPIITNRTLALAQRAAQSTPFCQVMSQLDDLSDPPHTDVHKVRRYAETYYNTVFALDPRSKVSDPTATIGTPRKVPLPARIVDAANTERLQMYSFLVRVRYAEQRADAGALDQRGVQARITDAITRLVLSGYTDADRSLDAFRVRACRPR